MVKLPMTLSDPNRLRPLHFLFFVPFLPRDAMHVRLSVRLSITSLSFAKMAKRRIT